MPRFNRVEGELERQTTRREFLFKKLPQWTAEGTALYVAIRNAFSPLNLAIASASPSETPKSPELEQVPVAELISVAFPISPAGQAVIRQLGSVKLADIFQLTDKLPRTDRKLALALERVRETVKSATAKTNPQALESFVCTFTLVGEAAGVALTFQSEEKTEHYALRTDGVKNGLREMETPAHFVDTARVPPIFDDGLLVAGWGDQMALVEGQANKVTQIHIRKAQEGKRRDGLLNIESKRVARKKDPRVYTFSPEGRITLNHTVDLSTQDYVALATPYLSEETMHALSEQAAHIGASFNLSGLKAENGLTLPVVSHNGRAYIPVVPNTSTLDASKVSWVRDFALEEAGTSPEFAPRLEQKMSPLTAKVFEERSRAFYEAVKTQSGLNAILLEGGAVFTALDTSFIKLAKQNSDGTFTPFYPHAEGAGGINLDEYQAAILEQPALALITAASEAARREVQRLLSGIINAPGIKDQYRQGIEPLLMMAFERLPGSEVDAEGQYDGFKISLGLRYGKYYDRTNPETNQREVGVDVSSMGTFTESLARVEIGVDSETGETGHLYRVTPEDVATWQGIEVAEGQHVFITTLPQLDNRMVRILDHSGKEKFVLTKEEETERTANGGSSTNVYSADKSKSEHITIPSAAEIFVTPEAPQAYSQPHEAASSSTELVTALPEALKNLIEKEFSIATDDIERGLSIGVGQYGVYVISTVGNAEYRGAPGPTETTSDFLLHVRADMAVRAAQKQGVPLTYETAIHTLESGASFGFTSITRTIPAGALRAVSSGSGGLTDVPFNPDLPENGGTTVVFVDMAAGFYHDEEKQWPDRLASYRGLSTIQTAPQFAILSLSDEQIIFVPIYRGNQQQGGNSAAQTFAPVVKSIFSEAPLSEVETRTGFDYHNEDDMEALRNLGLWIGLPEDGTAEDYAPETSIPWATPTVPSP